MYSEPIDCRSGDSDDEAGRPAKTTIFLNGKFYAGAMNGVHRVADRLIRELDRAADEERLPPHWDMRLLVPRAPHWAPVFRNIRSQPQQLGHTQLWEQMLLPWVARSGLLVSFANLAPMLHRRKITMVHDAQFRISPPSYPAKLRVGYRLLIPAGARSSARVLTVSDYARDTLETFGIASRRQVALVPNGGDHLLGETADRQASDRLGVEPGRFCLLFGSAAAYKNVGVVLDAFSYPALAGIKLVVVGAGEGMTPKAANVVFAGKIDDTILSGLYADALCLLYPSRTEGFGLPPLEAMTAGCPVICAPAGAMPEICQDAVLYAGMSDPGAWARAILRLHHAPGLRMAKIAAGRQRAAHFTWRRSGSRLIAEIDRVVSGSRADRYERSPAPDPL